MSNTNRATVSTRAGSDPDAFDSDASAMYSDVNYADGRDDHLGGDHELDFPEQKCSRRKLGGCVCKSLCDPRCMWCEEVVV